LGHPCKFQRVSRLGSVTARHSSIERQPNFAALNRGRHLYSTARPSRWALVHILVVFSIANDNAIIFQAKNIAILFTERELTSTFAICCRPSVCRLSAVLMHLLSQLKFSAIFLSHLVPWPSTDIHRKILPRSSQRNPYVKGFKRKR